MRSAKEQVSSLVGGSLYTVAKQVAKRARCASFWHRVEYILHWRNKKKEALVKWFDYPESFNSWIDAKTSTTDVVLITGRNNGTGQSLGAVACLLCWRSNILIRRQIDECLAAISASDNDVQAQC